MGAGLGAGRAVTTAASAVAAVGNVDTLRFVQGIGAIQPSDRVRRCEVDIG